MEKHGMLLSPPSSHSPLLQTNSKSQREVFLKMERNTHTEEHKWAVDETPGHTQKLTILTELPRTCRQPPQLVFLCGVMHVPDHRDSGVREASPGLWLSASLQTNQRNMTHFSMHPSWGVQVFIQPLLLGKSWAVIIPVMLPLLACSQPSLALWLSPLCEKCLQWGKALNPFIPQFLHLWICLARWMEENSLF